MEIAKLLALSMLLAQALATGKTVEEPATFRESGVRNTTFVLHVGLLFMPPYAFLSYPAVSALHHSLDCNLTERRLQEATDCERPKPMMHHWLGWLRFTRK